MHFFLFLSFFYFCVFVFGFKFYVHIGETHSENLCSAHQVEVNVNELCQLHFVIPILSIAVILVLCISCLLLTVTGKKFNLKKRKKTHKKK